VHVYCYDAAALQLSPVGWRRDQKRQCLAAHNWHMYAPRGAPTQDDAEDMDFHVHSCEDMCLHS
jgi:hypothetical protein